MKVLGERPHRAPAPCARNKLRTRADHARHHHRRRGGDRHGVASAPAPSARIAEQIQLARLQLDRRPARRQHVRRDPLGPRRQSNLTEEDARAIAAEIRRSRSRRRLSAASAQVVYGNTNWSTRHPGRHRRTTSSPASGDGQRQDVRHRGRRRGRQGRGARRDASGATSSARPTRSARPSASRTCRSRWSASWARRASRLGPGPGRHHPHPAVDGQEEGRSGATQSNPRAVGDDLGPGAARPRLMDEAAARSATCCASATASSRATTTTSRSATCRRCSRPRRSRRRS